jgi:4-hydroxy-tetrahydrodipicolinate reductase
MTYEVVQWGTGNVGMHALRAIIAHPELELAGLIVHSKEKVGRDAGELAGVGPVGVLATDDVDAVLAERPDCVSYMATGDLRPHEATTDMCRVLAAGVNVVSTSLVSLVYPPAAPDKKAVERLEEAAREGGASMFTSGIDPGFANDLVPLALLGTCERVDSVRVMEILNYDTYDQAEVLFSTMGFAQPLDAEPLLLLPGVLSTAWGPTVHMLAAGLGVELDELQEWHERRPAEKTFDIPAGRVEEGSTAALRFEVRGMLGGRQVVVLEHVTRLTDDIAPDWPQPAYGGCYRIVIEGSPSYTCDLGLRGDDGDHNTGGLVATAMRVLNAVPAVCAAAPGLLSPLDLPLVTGRGALRA